MRPHLPFLYLYCDVPALGPLPTGDVAIVEAEPEDPAFAAWDAEIGGRSRPQDIAIWRRAHRAVPVWFQRAGTTIGYGVLHQQSGGSLWTPDAITLGPIGVALVADAAACVMAAVAWARARNDTVRLALIGPHPALAPLLDAHFRLVEVETFCCSSAPSSIPPAPCPPAETCCEASGAIGSPSHRTSGPCRRDAAEPTVPTTRARAMTSLRC